MHFNFGQTLFPNRFQVDLPLLRAMGKAVFMTYQGDDARQGDYCREHFDITFANRVTEDYYGAKSDAAKRRRIARLGRYADGIYALNPDLLHVLPPQARFLPYANVDIEDYVPVPGAVPDAADRARAVTPRREGHGPDCGRSGAPARARPPGRASACRGHFEPKGAKRLRAGGYLRGPAVCGLVRRRGPR